MALNSIKTNISAGSTQSNIGRANAAASTSVARLSGGNRIIRASDDVAALSAGTALQTNVITLRQAMINTKQGETLLQVADGALSQISDILQRQKAIAIQAGSGSLTAAERGFLDQEFQNLSQEIDRLASQTNFNGVPLLDGTLFDVTFVEPTIVPGKPATGRLTFTAQIADQDTLTLNGVLVEIDDAGDGLNGVAPAGGFVVVDTTAIAGGTNEQYTLAIANALNASNNPLINSAHYEALGDTLIITARNTGLSSEQYTVDANASTMTFNASLRLTNEPNLFMLQASDDWGISAGDTIGIGVVGDSIIQPHNQQKAFAILDFTASTFADFVDGATIEIDDADNVGGGNVFFEFDTAAVPAVAAGTGRIDISDAVDKDDVLDAIVEAFNTYRGVKQDGTEQNDDFLVRQLEAHREENIVVLRTRDVGDVLQKFDRVSNITAAMATTVANAVIRGDGTFSNGANTGITTSGITNDAFTGVLQGWEANYTGQVNLVDLKLEVGDRTYIASRVNVAAAARVRFFSEAGDFFDIDLQPATGSLPVENQDDANEIAERLDVAFDDITFYQDREITSFLDAGDIYSFGEPIGTLTGSTFSLQLEDFDGAYIEDIRVKPPFDGFNDGLIEFDINGETYRSRSDITAKLNSNGIFEFTSLDDPAHILTWRIGTISLTDSAGNTVDGIEFDTEDKAAMVEAALIDAFGIGQSGQTLNFQVGVTTRDTLNISIESVTTDKLFDEEVINVLTKDNAARASDVLDNAIDHVTSVRAEVGSMQSRFGFASANVESSIQNQDAARGRLLDTDIATESTDYSVHQVQLQAGIAVLAQANQIPQELLKLVEQ